MPGDPESTKIPHAPEGFLPLLEARVEIRPQYVPECRSLKFRTGPLEDITLNIQKLFLSFVLMFASTSLAQQEAVEEIDEAPTITEELVDAVIEGETQTVKKLLDQGADPNALTYGLAPLTVSAALHGHANVVDALIEVGADIEATNRAGVTALMYASQYGHNEIVTALIKAGADVNAADSLGWTPLLHAAVGGNAEAASTLVSAGADTGAQDFFGSTAAQIAETRGHVEVIKALTTPNTEESGS